MILLIGIDGFDWRWQESLVKRRFFTQVLEAPIPLSPPSWNSIATGLRIETHGIRTFEDEIAKLKSGRDLPYLWRHLAVRGKTSVVVNFPWCIPPRPLNRLMVCGYPASRENYAHPREAQERWPYDELDLFNEAGLTHADYTGQKKLLDADPYELFAKAHEVRWQLFDRFVAEVADRPDLASINLMDPDRLCHVAYAAFQDSSARFAMVDAVASWIGALDSQLQPEWTFVFSDHGLDWELPPSEDGGAFGHRENIPCSRHGIFAYRGRDAAALPEGWTVKQEDVMPTVLALMELYPVFPVDGRAIVEVSQRGQDDYEAVMARLQEVGYIT